jgi:HAD superfamily hydrolase (TIGR01509 family)
LATAACELILFDCFNTLLHDPLRGAEDSGLCELGVELGLAPSKRAFLQRYRELLAESRRSGREITLEERLCRIAGVLDHVPAAVREVAERWQVLYAECVTPAPGAREMLEHWRGRRRLAVVSNFSVPGFPARLLTALGLDGYFEFVIDSGSFGYKKPDLRIFRHALERAELDAQQVLSIGDRHDTDIEPARALGMQVLHYRRPGGQRRAAPFGLPSIESWDELR